MLELYVLVLSIRRDELHTQLISIEDTEYEESSSFEGDAIEVHPSTS